MSPRRLAHALAVITLVSSGCYLFVYLYRWEWNRALIAGVFVLASELALVAATLAARLRAIERRLSADRPMPDASVMNQLRASAPPPTDHFAWLRDASQQTNVFVPVLLGAGVVLSALAWVVERLARATASPVMERRLASRLAVLALPSEPLVEREPGEPPPPPLTLLLQPVHRSQR